MQIAIISDIHNNELSLKKVLDFCAKKKIEKIICCGDLASQETLDFLNDNFSGDIFYALGNMDNDQLQNYKTLQKYKNTKVYSDFGEIEINGKKIAFVHFPKKAKKLAETGKYDFVFFGHTHKPWEEMIGKCKLLNPGNVTGDLYPPTFAIWNTDNDKFELIRIHPLA
jgi:hypothetical protein